MSGQERLPRKTDPQQAKILPRIVVIAWRVTALGLVLCSLSYLDNPKPLKAQMAINVGQSLIGTLGFVSDLLCTRITIFARE
mmetsp:Transcript_2789/g.17358  ORF Transcript_2789/g.17358 Transcript_2789/m.17358 type:complete len:82 (+) Transcript_2789:1635-1880(+)